MPSSFEATSVKRESDMTILKTTWMLLSTNNKNLRIIQRYYEAQLMDLKQLARALIDLARRI